jgi:asparagine synthase (glutamine-hydrolysing)
MCGIAGFIDPTAHDLDDALERMLKRMIHRGPDGEGKHIVQNLYLALGMRRLSIIDLETGGQPIWNEDHTHVIATVKSITIWSWARVVKRAQVRHAATRVLLIFRGPNRYDDSSEACLPSAF